MKTLILIDLSAIFWRYWHISESEDISSARRKTISLVESLVSEHDYAAVCIDAPPYKRSEIYPDYKNGRDRPAGAVEELRGVVRDMAKFGIPYYAVKGYEADDIIYTLAKQAIENQDIEVFISGTDKDLLQIENVTMTEPFERKVLTAEEKFGVPAYLVRDVLAITGDKADNVPGVPGIGPKKALQIIESFGSVESFLKMPDPDRFKLYAGLPNSISEGLMNNVETIKLSYNLVGLLEAPVELKLEKSIPVESNEPEVTEQSQQVEPVEQEEVKPVVVERHTEVAIRADNRNANWALSLEPVDLNAAWKLSNYLHESRMFGQFSNPQAVMAIIMRGRSLGMDATTALSNFHVIEGKPTMHASLIVGLVLTSGKCEYFDLVETSEKIAVWVTKRVSRPELKFSYTIEEANNAKLTGPTRSGKPSNWHTRPKTMLRWRAATELARAVYPDVITGLYTPDELESAVE